MDFILKGDIAYSLDKDHIKAVKDGYLACMDGKSRGVFDALPEKYSGLALADYSGKLIIPGMVDLHIHAPQFAFRGMHMDEELMDWLSRYTFEEEAKYADEEYARLDMK